jgi:hypothetical protein
MMQNNQMMIQQANKAQAEQQAKQPAHQVQVGPEQ